MKKYIQTLYIYDTMHQQQQAYQGLKSHDLLDILNEPAQFERRGADA